MRNGRGPAGVVLTYRPQSHPRGLTLVEILFVLGILAVALLGLVAASVSASATQAASRESTVANNAARDKFEEIRLSGDFLEIFRRYNSTPTDDATPPLSGGTAPGKHFDVPGLSAATDDTDGRVGEIIMSENPANAEELFEDVGLPYLGFPAGLDMDADGTIEPAVNKSTTYILLPVTIVIRWNGPGGNAQIWQSTVLYQRPGGS